MASLVLEELQEEPEPSVPDSVLQSLLLPVSPGPWDAITVGEEGAKQVGDKPVAKVVTPEAGFCLKTKTDKEEKVFINICKSDQVPSPKDITDEQLQTLLESGDPTQFRVPLSLGEPHKEKDSADNDCQAYDVIIGSSFYCAVQQRPVLKDFLLTIVLEGLEDKYGILLSRECKVLKNRKFLGALPEQTVRQKPKPFIIEMDRQESEADKKKGSKKSLISPVEEEESSSAPQPLYTILREPVEGELPEFLVLEVQLPGMASSKNLFLEVGEDRIVVKTRPNLFFLDIDLPYLVDNDETGAQFNRQSKILTVTLPVTGKAPT